VSSIDIGRDGAVRTITLTRPDKRNALNLAMLDLLHAAFSAVPATDERVVVLRAQGTVFCAGIDLVERLKNPAPRGESPIERVLDAMEHYPLPVVGIVQGDAIAGGCELALHCDFVVAADTARFGMSLAQIGLAPTWFLAKKLIELAGPVVGREILLLGDPLPAAAMREHGIIGRVAPADALAAEAAAVIDRLARNAPLSLRAMKAMLVRQMAFRDGIDHDDIDDLIQTARESIDAKEGIAARLEKREARFTGE
jgi:enoyl-CoA hydratase/carnithine racemase